jgi:hypothetical protein
MSAEDFPKRIYANERKGSNGISCLDYRNYDEDVEYIRSDFSQPQPTDEEIINYIIKECRHKDPPEIMMDEQAFYEGAKAMRDGKI